MKEVIVTISSKGQITLPKSARERLKVKPGEKVKISLPISPAHEVHITRQPTLTDYFGKMDGFWGDGDAATEIRKLRNQDE